MNLLRSVNSWLQNQTGDEISYEALKKILDNSALVSRDRAVQTNIHLIIAMKLGRLVHSCWSSQHCNYSALTFCLSFILCIHLFRILCPLHTALRKFTNANLWLLWAWARRLLGKKEGRGGETRQISSCRENREQGIAKCTQTDVRTSVWE